MCQRDCWDSPCHIVYIRCPEGLHCIDNHARLNATSDICPGRCVPIKSPECVKLKAAGDACRKAGQCEV